MTIEVTEWTKKHRSWLEAWPMENNPLLPAFLLRVPEEPYDYAVASFAILNEGALIGRFSYRMLPDRVAFIGLVLSPAVRGFGFGVPAMRSSLLALCAFGVTSAFGSVAAANKPALAMDLAAGFRLMSTCDWRQLPANFDLNLLARCPVGSYRLDPVPAMLYHQVSVSLSGYVYRGGAIGSALA